MKTLLIACMLALVVGCNSTPEKPEPSVITKNVILIVKLPDSVLLIPPHVPPIDLATATQREVAIWMAENEKRIVKLESNLAIVKNAVAAMIKKENLKEGDYKIIELTEQDLAPK